MKFFIDFDGVICNSLKECYVSSKIAADSDFSVDHPISEDDFKDFIRLRPLVRSGEDYVLIHSISKSFRHQLGSQEEFDALREKNHPVLDTYKAQIYAVRDHLLKNHKESWLSLNLLYPGWDKVLAKLSSVEEVYILSTKKSAYILEILNYHGITFPKERVLYATAKEKGLKMRQHALEGEISYLLDDQIAHFSSLDPRDQIGIYATWGFGRPSDYKPSWGLEEALEKLTPEILLNQDPKENSFLHW